MNPIHLLDEIKERNRRRVKLAALRKLWKNQGIAGYLDREKCPYTGQAAKYWTDGYNKAARGAAK
jgi:hypothetical protein